MQRFTALTRTLARSQLSAVRGQCGAASGVRGFASSSLRMAEKKAAETQEGAQKGAQEGAQEDAEEFAKAEQQAEADVADALNATKEALVKREKENAELKDRYMRAVADFRNLQGTTQREMQKAKDFALQKFAKDLIESIDNFEHATNAVSEEDLSKDETLKTFYDGVKMTKDVFEKTLEKYGIKRVDPLDQEFDPNRHEALFQVPSADKEPGTVVIVQRPGYELNGRVLRAPKVGVAKKIDE